MASPLQDPVVSILKRFSTSEGEKKLQIAALWEEVSKSVSRESQILKLENHILFVKITNPVVGQELKMRVQRSFVDQYEKKFGEKLKDIRFIMGD